VSTFAHVLDSRIRQTMKNGNALRQPGAPLVLASSEDVQALLSCVHPLWFGSNRRVIVRLPDLDAAESRRWEVRLGWSLNACGCFTGTLPALAALAGCVIAFLGRRAAGTPTTWVTVLSYFGVVIGATFTGKLGGLATARVLLRRDLKRLLRQTTSSKNSVTESERWPHARK
jgi:hypothetical protein